MNYIDDIRSFLPKSKEECKEKELILNDIALFGKNILTRDNEIMHFTSSGLVLNPDKTKMLMVLHNIYQTWAWTGGHADGQQDLWEVAKREVQEETGVKNFLPFSKKLFSLDILTVNNHWKKSSYVPSHLHLNTSYVFIVPESESLKKKPDENSGVRWINLCEIEKYSNEKHIIPIYRKIIERAQHVAKN
ncbi:MAG: NUDIX hydrolase [Clostridiales bacterium]|nr:NUDIX hydrolase [Clostridiales bacterium]